MAPFPSLPPPPRALFADWTFFPASSARKLLANSIGGCQSPSHVCRKDADQFFQIKWHNPNRSSCSIHLESTQLKQLSTRTKTATVELPALLGRKNFHWTTSLLLKSLIWSATSDRTFKMRNKAQRKRDFLSSSKTRYTLQKANQPKGAEASLRWQGAFCPLLSWFSPAFH